MMYGGDPSFESLRALAQKIESMARRANTALLKGARLSPEETLEVIADIQAKMLRLDDHGRRQLGEALEEKRVRALAQDNLALNCVLSAAVALSLFKNQPRRLSSGLLHRSIERLRERSTTGVGLAAFSLATFYAVMGRGAAGHLSERRERRTLRS